VALLDAVTNEEVLSIGVLGGGLWCLKHSQRFVEDSILIAYLGWLSLGNQSAVFESSGHVPFDNQVFLGRRVPHRWVYEHPELLPAHLHPLLDLPVGL
jgi:hypothetical protein